MDEFKLCSDGVFMPADLPCPPPYSGPYYYYPYDNTPSPPTNTASSTTATSSIHQGASSSLSAGSIAGIMVMASCLFAVIFALAIKFRGRFITGFAPSRRRNHGRVQQNGDGDQQLDGNDVAVNVMSGHASGLGEKLVSLLPVSEYVSDHAINVEGKQDLDAKQRSSTTECAVCLSFFEERDIVRVLPKCHHTFHICCIDKWFESHVNCPLCRERITLQTIQLSSDAIPARPEEDEQTMDEQQEPIITGSDQVCQYGESALSNITSNNTQGHIGPAAYQGLTHEEDEAMPCAESKKELEEEDEEEQQQHVNEAAGPSVCGSHLVWIKGAYRSIRDSKVERLPYPQCTEDDGIGRCGRGNNNNKSNNNEGDLITVEGSSRMLRKSRSMGSMITHHLDCFTTTSAAQASKYLSAKV